MLVKVKKWSKILFQLNKYFTWNIFPSTFRARARALSSSFLILFSCSTCKRLKNNEWFLSDCRGVFFPREDMKFAESKTNLINNQKTFLDKERQFSESQRFTSWHTWMRVTSMSTTFSFQSELISVSLFIRMWDSTSFSGPLPSILNCLRMSSWSCSNWKAPGFIFFSAELPRNSYNFQEKIGVCAYTFCCSNLWLPKMSLITNPLRQKWDSKIHYFFSKLLCCLSCIHVSNSVQNISSKSCLQYKKKELSIIIYGFANIKKKVGMQKLGISFKARITIINMIVPIWLIWHKLGYYKVNKHNKHLDSKVASYSPCDYQLMKSSGSMFSFLSLNQWNVAELKLGDIPKGRGKKWIQISQTKATNNTYSFPTKSVMNSGINSSLLNFHVI